MNEDFPEPLPEERPFPLTVRRDTRAQRIHLLLLCLILMIVGVGVSLLPTWYGDGWIEVAGVVYEWVDAPPGAESRVFVDEPALEGLRIIPLAAASVTLFPHADDLEEPWREDGETDSEGRFGLGSVCDPRPHHALVRIGKDSYAGIEVRIRHDGSEGEGHRIEAILVRR